MSGKFLFGEWRFVGRLMRKKGLLVVVVLVLQAGLLVSLGIVLSLTRVKDSIRGEATVRLEHQVLHASFKPDKRQPTESLLGVAEAVLNLAIPAYPGGLSLRVQVIEIEADNVVLRSSDTKATRLDAVLRRGGSRTALTPNTLRAQLHFRKRTLLSAIIQDRKKGRKETGLFEALQ